MSLTYAQMGLKVVGAFGDLAEAKHKTRMDEISRAYQQKMSGISASMQLNVETANEIATRDALVRAGEAIQVQSLKDRASASVESAASGMSGGSVSSTMRGLMRSRLQALQARKDKVVAQAAVSRNNRRNIALARVMGTDISPIAKPNVAMSLLGLGASIIDVYDTNQPEGSKIADTIAGWGRK